MSTERIFAYSFVGSRVNINACMRALIAKNLKPLRNWQIKLYQAMARGSMIQFNDDEYIVLLPYGVSLNMNSKLVKTWSYFYGGFIKIRRMDKRPQLIYQPGGFEFTTTLQPETYFGFWQRLSQAFQVRLTFTQLYPCLENRQYERYDIALDKGKLYMLNSLDAIISDYHNEKTEVLSGCVQDWLRYNLTGKHSQVACESYLKQSIKQWCLRQQVEIKPKDKELLLMYLQQEFLDRIVNFIQIQPLSILKTLLGEETFDAFNLLTEAELARRYNNMKEYFCVLNRKQVEQFEHLCIDLQDTPLGWALSLRWLSKQKMNLSDKLSRVDICGNSALFYAIGHGGLANVQAVSHVAVLNLPNKQGITPLMLASMLGRKDLVLYLIKSGARVNVINEQQGCYALLLALWYGHLHVVKTLLEAGGRVFCHNNYHKEVLQQARKCGHHKLLLRYASQLDHRSKRFLV